MGTAKWTKKSLEEIEGDNKDENKCEKLVM
jgi:hypothetical protein